MAYKETPNDRAQHARTESPFLTTTQAASYVGLSRRTLEKMRTTGSGRLSQTRPLCALPHL